MGSCVKPAFAYPRPSFAVNRMVRPSAYFLVHQPIIAPVTARPGEYLALYLAHPRQTVSVISRDRQQILQREAIPLAMLTAQLLTLCRDQVIQGLSASDEVVLLRVA